MKAARLTFALLFAALAAACSAPLVPAPERPSVRFMAEQSGEAGLLASAEAAWRGMWRGEAGSMETYNAKLLALLRLWRYELAEHDRMPAGVEVCYNGRPAVADMRAVYSDIVPAADIEERDLEKHYEVPGAGVPMVGIIPAEKVANTDRRFAIKSNGTVATLTAVLSFPKGQRPRLDFKLRYRTETLRNGRKQLPLAGNFSAPIELYWNLTSVKKNRYLGLLRPQELRDTTGLSCMESYDPAKIPVILTHGLASSAATFDNLVNRMVADADIRARYQFWYFNYPTGTAWTRNAAVYRESLRRVREQLDPERRNPNWDKMIVVGHSMGGLITHYSQCIEPWKMLESAPGGAAAKLRPYLSARYVKQALPAEVQQLEPFRKDYCFEPVRAGMVVYMATPHRGAPLARYRIVTALTKLVQLPQNLLQEAYSLATLQENTVLLNPAKLTEWFTSVSQLSPSGYSIRGLQTLQVRRVPTYSFIGNRGSSCPLPETSDGVVPYWSSHIPWGEESVVPADHHVQDSPETAEKLIEILKNYR